MRLHCLSVVFCLFFALGYAVPAPVDAFAKTEQKSAKNKSAKKTTKKKKKKTAQQPAADKYAAVVVDADTGYVLYEKNADKQRYPASLTKMMTLYLTFDALKKGRLKPNEMLHVSKRAASQPQTNINLSEGDRISVEDCIKALVVRSANDASVVLAEGIGQTQWNFALMMTQKARELGMRDTVFKNPNGLPDSNQYTNAYDMARLGIALRRDFPEYYSNFRVTRFDYGGVTYTTHNRVMLRYDGADGIKTGYIRASGFNLVTSVRKNGYNLVAVVMGGESATARDNQMIALLDRSFAELSSKRPRSVAAGGARKSSMIMPEAIISAHAPPVVAAVY